MDVNLINPFIKSTLNVFRTMLGWSVERTGLSLGKEAAARYAVSGVIGLTGKIRGNVVFNLSTQIAVECASAMLGEEVLANSPEMSDAVGEMTNMVAGGAKADLAEYQLSLCLPTVIIGDDHIVTFPKNVVPICIDYDSPKGPFALEVGLIE